MKKINIPQVAGKQTALRIPHHVYDKAEALSKIHKCTPQDILRFVLENEIENYE